MSSSPYAPMIEADQDELLTGGVVGRRMIAWLLDAMILGLLAFVVWFGLAAFTLMTLGFGAPAFALLAFLPAAYGFLSLISGLQASPGQAMMGLIVVRDIDLGPPTAAQAMVSVIAYTATIALGAIWCAVAVVTTRHRTVHDFASGLVVVKRSALQIPLTRSQMGWNIGTNETRDGGRPRA